MRIREVKKSIVHTIAVRGTFDGALSRNRIYKKKTRAAERKKFRDYLTAQLEQILQRILQKNEYSDLDHFRAIAAFSNKVSRHSIYRTYLVNNKLTIGTAQKLLNLYWKMNWLLKPGIRAPLHCPFDSIIIRELDPSVRNLRWTQFDDIDDYKRLVKAAQEQSGGRSIFKWELETYYQQTIRMNS